MNIDRAFTLYRKALPAFVLGMILPLDVVIDSILYVAPNDHWWYVVGAILSCFSLIGMWYLFRQEKIHGIFDLFLYDILAMLFGLFMNYYRLNPAEPSPIPFQVVSITLLLLKLYFALCFVNRPTVVIGPFSYLQQRSLKLPKGDSTAFLLGTFGCMLLAYLMLRYIGHVGTSGLRATLGCFWLMAAFNFLNEHRSVQREYQDACEEQQFLMIRMAELEHQLQDQQQMIADDEELIKYFNDADPAYRKLALKLLRANYERNEEMKKQEELRSQGVFTLQGYVKAHNDGQWQQQDGAKA
ncbi:hypothetical protein V8J88_01620 [Massilia sp. W12]|uniref:hypothetical protein n=1 Tax=Massilia sp. W12 TaxID=3126507 RepID=UPI0030CF33BF